MPCGTSGLEFGFGDHQIESSIRCVYLNRIAVLHLAQCPPRSPPRDTRGQYTALLIAPVRDHGDGFSQAHTDQEWRVRAS